MKVSESALAKKKCVPCSGGTPPLKGKELEQYKKQLGNDWHLIDNHRLEKEYTFETYRKALTFTNKIGELAEREGHHPEILLGFRKVKIQLWTHKIDGLSESDFILAAKCDEQLEKMLDRSFD